MNVKFYKDGKLDSVAQYFNRRSILVSEEVYNNGQLILKKVFKNEKLKALNLYEEGKLNYENKTFYDSGDLLSSVFWKEGLEEGSEFHYYPNGELYSKGQNENGAKTGLWKYYNELGALIKIEEYDKGLKNGIWEYYNNEKVTRTEIFKDGILISIDSLHTGW